MPGRPPLPPPAKGSVTPLSSVFPTQEALKASQRVHHTLTQHQNHLDTLHTFISDNSSLINLVHRLPDDLHHPIMVPFGPAAFFPGKIVHTNELMVLLGEGYYAERTAKQTVDILKRRGKGLESQVEGVKAVMDDLKAEALFFDATANEAADGIVEIREDYVEETSPAEEFAPCVQKSDSVNPKPNKTRGANEDDEYNRILARLDELEKEEEEAEKGNEIEEDEEENDSIKDPHLRLSRHTLTKGGESSEVRAEGPAQKPRVPKDGPAHDQGLSVTPLNSAENSFKVPAVKKKPHNTQKEEVPKESTHPGINNSKEIIGSIVEQAPTISNSKEIIGSIVERAPIVSNSKEIIGSIVERAPIMTNPIGGPAGGRSSRPIGEPAGGHSSRPVSRFKQQRK